MKRLFATVLVFFILGACPGGASGVERDLAITAGQVRLVVRQLEGAWQEEYQARRGAAWVTVLRCGSVRQPGLLLRKNGLTTFPPFRSAERVAGENGAPAILLRAVVPPGVIEKRVQLAAGFPGAEVSVTFRTGGPATLQCLQSRCTFEGGDRASAGPPDFVFTPQLRPDSAQVIADHVFRSPALMFQHRKVFAALVPGLTSIDGRGRAIRATADLQARAAGGPFFAFGLQNWSAEPYRLRNTHLFYTSSDSLGAVLGDTVVSFRYELFIQATAPAGRGYRMVTRYFWERYGQAGMQEYRGPQQAPFASDIRKAWYEYLPAIALDTVYEGRAVTLLRQGRLAWSNHLPAAADNDCWFTVWFNALRTAYGMHLYGSTIHDTALTRRAEGVLALALCAPQREGIAPSIFYVDSLGGHWVADHAWGGISHGECYAMFHNAWTGYWLLEWSSRLPARRAEILAYAERLGGFLLSRQTPRGVIPSWYDPVTLAPMSPLRDDNAETAGAALFLARLFQASHQRKYLQGAERAMQYVFREVVPARRWFDFETFFSCSRKPLGFFDSVTCQNPQNTLSMHQAAAACRLLYAVTGRTVYRERGAEIMDYLCLYQQVWSPRWLSRELLGGFGVQNTDAEWSDARQGYFAATLMEYYEMTGRREYFERGIAALRAMFALYESPASPRTAENYAHSAHDEPAGVTGIHWGTGSCVVSVHLIRERFGDAFIDAAAEWGCGIDGCRVSKVRRTGRTIAFDLRDAVGSPRTLLVKFRGVGQGAYDLHVNGSMLGRYGASQLREGIPVTLL